MFYRWSCQARPATEGTADRGARRPSRGQSMPPAAVRPSCRPYELHSPRPCHNDGADLDAFCRSPPPALPREGSRLLGASEETGLRPIQIWVPDVRSKAVAREAHRQSLAVARSGRDRDDQAFLDSISVWNDE
jgi:hypothetical protein